MQRNAQALALKYHQAGQGSVDGNTVDMDAERAKFAENSIRFQFELEQVKDEGQGAGPCPERLGRALAKTATGSLPAAVEGSLGTHHPY